MPESVSIIELPHGHTEALGRLTVAWSQLEFYMTLAVGEILGNINHADVIMHSLGSSKARADILRALATECVENETARANLLDAIEKVRAVAGERNDMIHGLWGVRTSDNAAILHLRKPATRVPFKREKRP